LKYNREMEKTSMNDRVHQHKGRTRLQRLFVVALAVGSAFAMGAEAQPQAVKTPTTPTIITPPVGNTAFAVGHALVGTQGYTCLPTSTGASTATWTAPGKSARPEATLFQSFLGQDFQIITHFLSPNTNPFLDVAPNPQPFGNATWQSSFDSSKVWAAVLNGNVFPAGGDPSCPNAGSIACLLLQSVGAQDGPTGGTFLSKTTFVQRLNTNGGSAPADGCFTSADVGKQALVPYTADYFFFRKDK
jgi:hypothetical protein